MNIATHKRHANGFSPVCTRKWVFKFHDIPNCLPQYVQRYSRTGLHFGWSSFDGGGALAGGNAHAPQGCSILDTDAGSALGGLCEPPGGVNDLSC